MAGSSTNASTPILSYGRYSVENCRAYLPRLTDVIDYAIDSVKPAVTDAQLGHRSTHGFRAFFKYDGAKEYVEEILRSIYTMRPIRAMEPWPGQRTAPHFACVTRSSKELYPWVVVDPWHICQFSNTAAFWASESSFIFFCPRFFDNPERPTNLAGRNCPGVRDNRWLHNNNNLYHYQTYTIIHELVHFYLQHQSLSGISTPPEQYGIDGCVALSPLNSLHNPTNYQAYVASKSRMLQSSSWSELMTCCGSGSTGMLASS